ncbi:hypothetical protein DFH09DRAFT_1082708 [Mycena vulgaris]|nr:hypothetical protein DFH09DRAFT_1082708 [Mycena vulgaris]
MPNTGTVQKQGPTHQAAFTRREAGIIQIWTGVDGGNLSDARFWKGPAQTYEACVIMCGKRHAETEENLRESSKKQAVIKDLVIGLGRPLPKMGILIILSKFFGPIYRRKRMVGALELCYNSVDLGQSIRRSDEAPS